MKSPFCNARCTSNRESYLRGVFIRNPQGRRVSGGGLLWCLSVVVTGCGLDSSGLGSAAGSGAAGMGGATSSVAVTRSGGTTNGGATATGGTTSSGGIPSAGGLASTGGVVNAGGTISTGGTTSGGGTLTTGGTVGTGGTTSTVGTTSTGGTVATGGTTSTGGMVATGGTTSTGGMVATGGTMSTGGTVATGGTTSTGGSSCVGFTYGAPELINGLGLDSHELWGPSLSADGLTLYFAASLSTGGDDDIYVATRSDRGTTFSTATPLTSINTTSGEGSPFISSDGTSLYFYSNRDGGVGDRDIWMAKWQTASTSFGSPTLVANVNGLDGDHLPWLSEDQLTLIFTSARSGSGDLYVATREHSNEDFSVSSIQPVGGVNTVDQEDRAALSRDGQTLFFVSSRATTNPLGGDKDIWYATRDNAQSGYSFTNAQNLAAVNSSVRDIDVSLSADDKELFFVSKRSGRALIYRSVRSCP